MKKKYRPYMIDITYELETYKNIGRDYGNSKTADIGGVFNFFRFVRKFKNRKQTKYRFCNTYSDWEKHMHNVLNKNIINYDDMVHWLIGHRNYAKQRLEAVKAVLIPIYITLISLYKVLWGKENDPMITVLIPLFITVFASAYILSDATVKVNFFDDFIKIAQKEKDYNLTNRQ